MMQILQQKLNLLKKIKYLLKCINDGFISSSGPFVKEFEKKFAKRVNRRFAISVTSGTAALQLAFESLNLKKKDEVINSSSKLRPWAKIADKKYTLKGKGKSRLGQQSARIDQ